MSEERFQTSAVVYREVGNELVVIQVTTGCFYYFNKTTKQLLDFFRHPASLEEFLRRSGLGDEAERAYLKDFIDGLKEKRILETSPLSTTEPTPGPASPYDRPQFLRSGEKKLDDIAVLT